MYVEIPTKVSLYGLIKDIDNIGAAHSNMVLEAVLTDVLHQLLQIVDLSNCDTAVHTVWVVGNLTLAQVGLDDALRIVCRNAEEGKRTFTDLGINSTKSINFIIK